MNLKGSLPLLILHVLATQPLHGYAIAQAIKQSSAGVLDFKEGNLYPTLHSLEHKRLLESHTVVESGRTRRYYQLTDAGRAALVEERQEWTRYARAVMSVLGEAT